MKEEIYIEHYVNDMDQSMVQNCIFCGKTISDYNVTLWTGDGGPPKGFTAGVVFVSKAKNQTILTKELTEGEISKKCTHS